MTARESWRAAVNPSILGPVFMGARKDGGAWTTEPPAHVRAFLNLVPAGDGARTVLGDFAQFDETKKPGQARTLPAGVGAERAAAWRVIAETGCEASGVTLGRSRRGHVTLCFTVDAPGPEAKPRKARNGDVRDLRGLADHLGVDWRAGRVIGSRPILKGRKVVGSESVTDPAERPAVSLVDAVRHRLYKRTDCGIGFAAYDWGVVVSGYCEGVDAECQSHELRFPFSPAEFDAAVADADAEGVEMFDATHGCAHCGVAGKCRGKRCKTCADETAREFRPIDPACVACGGAGTVF